MKYCPSRVTAVWLRSLQNSQVLPSLSRVSRTDTFSREGTPYFSVSTVALQGMYTEHIRPSPQQKNLDITKKLVYHQTSN